MDLYYRSYKNRARLHVNIIRFNFFLIIFLFSLLCRGDFDVEFESEHSGAFSLLRDACMKLLSLQLSSEDFQGQLLRTYQRRVHVYSRIMWGMFLIS